MKKYGRLLESRVNVFYSASKYQITFTTWFNTYMRFGLRSEVENIDSTVFDYSDADDSMVVIKEPGWYDVKATIDFYQSSNFNRSIVYGWIETDNGGDGNFSEEEGTRVYAYSRNEKAGRGTIDINIPICVEQAGTRIRVTSNRALWYLGLVVSVKGTSLYMQRLRPLQDGEK